MKSILTIIIMCLCSAAVAQDSLNVSLQRQEGTMHNIALNIGYSNVGLFGDVDTLRGVQLNMFSSVTRKEMRGVSMAGIVSSVKQNAYGVQMSGFISAANGNMRGVQISGIYNIAKR